MTKQKEDQEKLALVIAQIHPLCKNLNDFLKVHVPKCEYCQGFLSFILDRKNG